MTQDGSDRPPESAAVVATVDPEAKPHYAAVVAAFLGWTLDAFDFFIVVFCLTAIGKEFGFGEDDKPMAFAMTMTLAFRPVGAFAFGLLADRYGRRIPLMIDLVFYSLFEVLSGLAPTYTTFLICRMLFGIGMGGEWGVGASLAMENAPPRLRGILSGLLQEGYAAGYLLAAGAYFFVYPRWGWRPMFFLGGLPALLALFVRFRVKESAVWQKSKHDSWGNLSRAILSHWKIFVYLTLLMTTMNLISHGTQDLYPTFLERQFGFDARHKAAITAVSMVGAIIGGTFFGRVSDRFGRRRAMVIALALAIFAIPLWAFSHTVALLVVGAFTIQFMVQGAWGVVPAHLSELSPDSVRGFLPGFAYQCGGFFSSFVVTYQAALGKRMGYSIAMSLIAVIVFSLGIIATLAGREKHGVQFGQ